MTKNQSLLFRLLLFLAGVGIIVLAFCVTKGDRELNRIDAFVWVSIGLMYLVFFVPFFFSAISIANFSGKLPSLALVWTGVLLYIAVSVAVILLLAVANVIGFDAAVIIQAVLVFLFAVNVYFAYFASSRVRTVAAQEAGKQQYINQIKPKAQSLLLSVNRLSAEYGNAQKTLKQAIEDIKFVYPVDGGAGSDLELRILQSLNTISEYCGNIQTGAHTAALESEAENLRMLVKERKLLRN